MPGRSNQQDPPVQERSSAARDGSRGGRAKGGTQRDRLVEAMIDLCASSGYQAVSVAQLSARAGVSSATFYEQFRDKEACMLAAYEAARRRVFRHMPRIADDATWSTAACEFLRGLSDGLQIDPNAGRVLFIEALAGGADIRRVRDETLDTFERGVDQFLASRADETLDIPVAALEGARRHIVARHLRTSSEDLLPDLVADMVAWMGTYAVPAGTPRWSAGERTRLAVPDARFSGPAHPAAGLERLPRGRHGLSPGVVNRSRRARIVHATAAVMLEKGYANVTVADIVTAAGVARDVFYEHFENKQHAFLEAQQYATQFVFDTCATAFFSAKEWPDRVWNGLHAVTTLMASYPALSHLRVVECYAAGPQAVRGTEELMRAGRIFLEEGYRQSPQANALPRLCSDAITGAVFEILYRLIAHDEAAELPRRLPELAYIAIAPFVGPERAVELVEERSSDCR
jgi:AcrR family transcriptional regulator